MIDAISGGPPGDFTTNQAAAATAAAATAAVAALKHFVAESANLWGSVTAVNVM